MDKHILKEGDTFVLTEKMIKAKETSKYADTTGLRIGMEMKIVSINNDSYSAIYKYGFKYAFSFYVVDNNLNSINPLLYNLKK